MSKTDKKKPLSDDNKLKTEKDTKEQIPDKIEDKLKVIEEKLLRTMAEMENQRRRFEKERQEAFEFGGYNFAKESLSLLDNIDRAINSFKSDENLKDSKDLNKIIDGIEIVKKDLISIFKKNGVEPIDCMKKKFGNNITFVEGEPWKFNDEVALNFDEHVHNSIPHYNSMQHYISKLSEWFVKDRSVIYDLGCSSGNTILNISQKNYKKKKLKFICIDSNKKMLAVSKKKVTIVNTVI